jgi:hypothetical protein
MSQEEKMQPNDADQGPAMQEGSVVQVPVDSRRTAMPSFLRAVMGLTMIDSRQTGYYSRLKRRQRTADALPATSYSSSLRRGWIPLEISLSEVFVCESCIVFKLAMRYLYHTQHCAWSLLTVHEDCCDPWAAPVIDRGDEKPQKLSADDPGQR